MKIFLEGGPFAGNELDVPSPPDAIELPLYAALGGYNQTARYERIKKSTNFEYKGRRETLEIPPVAEKSETIQKRVARPPKPKDGKLVYNSKKGRYEVK